MDISEEILGKDYYEFLQCDPTATDATIKTAYRKKALLCHPDKHPDNADAAEMFKQLKSIVDLLLDEHKRARYDRQREAANRRRIDAEQRAQEELYRKQRMQQESERRKRAQTRATEEAYRQQKAHEEFQRQENEQQESYRQERARQESERQERARQDSERQERARQDSERQERARQESERRQHRARQNEPQGASYQDAGTSSHTPRRHPDIESIAAAALAALNKSHRDRMREQAKRRGMGRSKRPSCFSANLDPNCRSFWTYPRPTPTFSNLDPNSPIFHPRTMPGQTV